MRRLRCPAPGLLAVAAVLALIGCDSDAPAPTVRISDCVAASDSVLTGAEVRIRAQVVGSEAGRIAVRFGNVATTPGPATVHPGGRVEVVGAFSAPGRYTVTLHPTPGEAGEGCTMDVYAFRAPTVNAVTLLAIPMTDPSGLPWDANGGPDLHFAFEGPAGSTWVDELRVDVEMLPVIWTAGMDYWVYPGEPYTLTLWDSDGYTDGETPRTAEIGRTPPGAWGRDALASLPPTYDVRSADGALHFRFDLGWSLDSPPNQPRPAHGATEGAGGVTGL